MTFDMYAFYLRRIRKQLVAPPPGKEFLGCRWVKSSRNTPERGYEEQNSVRNTPGRDLWGCRWVKSSRNTPNWGYEK